MGILFILLCNHHKSDSINWATLLPLYIAIGGLIIKIISDYCNKRNDIRNKLSDDLISITDKMLRNASTAESWALEYRYYEARNKVDPKTRYEEYADYYHHELEKLTGNHDNLRAELKTCVKNLNKYWKDESEKKELITLMKKIVLIRLKNFSTIFESEKTVDSILLKRQQESDKIKENLMFKEDGICFLLILIQKIIDKDSPTLYFDEEKEGRILAMIESYYKTKQETNH